MCSHSGCAFRVEDSVAVGIGSRGVQFANVASGICSQGDLAVSRRVMSCHVMSCHVMSSRVASRHLVSHCIASCRVMSCVSSCRVAPRRVMLCHVPPCRVVLCLVASCRVMLVKIAAAALRANAPLRFTQLTLTPRILTPLASRFFLSALSHGMCQSYLRLLHSRLSHLYLRPTPLS